MNRPRRRGNRDLPINLYAKRIKGSVYYYYLRPDTRKEVSIGKDRTQAILAANQLNTILVKQISLVDKVLGGANSFSKWISKYKKIRFSEGLADATKIGLENQLSKIDADLGSMPINDLSVFHIAEFLDQWITKEQLRTASHMRATLIKCLDYAVSQGLINTNPASKTRPITAKTKRQRLTKEQFDAIYENAQPHIRNAMMLGLITLQRREDIVNMKFSDIKEGHLQVIQSKTGKAKKGARVDSTNKSAHLRIEVTDQLQQVIQSCRSTRIVSKFMVHQIRTQRYGGKVQGEIKKGEKLVADVLTRGFSSARDKTGLFDDIPPRQRPSFHEIRSLGAHLYKEQGIDPQFLLGHTSAKMTSIYLDGHGLEWTTVSACLNI